MTRSFVVPFVLVLVLVACSGGGDGSSSSSGGSASSSGGATSSSGGAKSCTEVAAVAPAFSAYCTVQSKGDLEILRASPPMGFAGQGECLPSGATLYLAVDERDGTQGFAFVENGKTPAKISVGLGDPLVADTHYTGNCPLPASAPPKVLLADMNVYAGKDLGGTACKVTAGTELPDFAFSNVESGIVSVASPVLQTACGYGLGYTKDVNVASLVKK